MCAFERSEKGMEFFMDDEKDIIEVEKVEDLKDDKPSDESKEQSDGPKE